MMNKGRRPQEDPEMDPLAEKKAVALKYDPEKNMAPKVVAKGKGHVAENILEAARKGKVPVYQNQSLVNMLMALELDKEIKESEAKKLYFSQKKFKVREKEQEKEGQYLFQACHAGLDQYTINWAGNMYACELLTQGYTEPFKDGFA